MPRLSSKSFLVLVWTMGFGARVVSLYFNARYPHGDVVLHCGVLKSLAQHYRFWVPFPGPVYKAAPISGWGYPMDQHPPLWPALGALLYPMTRDCYRALQLLTLLGGTLLMPLTFVVFRRLFDRSTAQLASACVALSALLIDFSANGSPYIWEAIIFLIFLGLAAQPFAPKNAFGLGLLLGLAYLINYQSIILVPSIAVLNGVAFYIRCRAETRSTPVSLKRTLLPFIVAFVVVLPWLVRNSQIFGNPFYNINLQYVWNKAGVPTTLVWEQGVLVIQRRWEGISARGFLFKELRWFVANAYFLARKLFILAPLLFPLLLPGIKPLVYHVYRQMTSRNQEHVLYQDFGGLSILLLIFFYLLLSAAWPVFKFRFFVPLLPLVFGLGAYGLRQLPFAFHRPLSRVALGGVIVLSTLTFQAVPSHTYYYDGALTTDNFGERGEQLAILDLENLRDVSRRIRDAGYESGPVMTEALALYYYLEWPLVQPAPQPFLAELVCRYRVKYALAEASELSLYETYGFELLYRNPRYAFVRLAELPCKGDANTQSNKRASS